MQLHTTDAVRLRGDRGTRARVLTVLPRGTDLYAQCWRTVDDVWWADGEVMSGPARGRHGWVVGACTATGYRR
ncbi:hypothetical protein ACF061_37425 [Streptomyces sp. NPDC015220]|uniref:hypothetical protein n=1 Tax=Streptomyces sp. NPDC015220 TaxID=3364947 RepID=UPI0036F4E550